MRASANEPFLTVEVEGRTARVWTVDGDDRVLPVTARRVTASGVRIEAGSSEGQAVVELTEQPCEDDMSGAAFPLTARITVDDVTNRGCARRLTDPAPRPF